MFIIIRDDLSSDLSENYTNFSAVPVVPHATELSDNGSANRDNCELPGLVSALRGRSGTGDV
jgi:hypothetical protein